jgi:site-specific recombinase XerD
LSELELSLREYLIKLRGENYSPATIEKYGWHLERWVTWLSRRGITRPGQLTRLLLREWAAELYELPQMRRPKEKWGPATIRLAVMTVRGVLGFLADEGQMGTNLVEALKAPAVKKRVQRTLTSEEVGLLLAACDDSRAGQRNATLVSLLVDSGLRASEVARLRWTDLNIGVRLPGVTLNFLVVVGKGGDEQIAYFGQATVERLQRWQTIRRAAPEVDEVFSSLTRGEPMTRYGIRRALSLLGKKAGVSGVTPHSLRRAFACIADEAGASTRDVQAWGRWSDITMVERYTQALRAGRKYVAHSPMDYLKKGPSS